MYSSSHLWEKWTRTASDVPFNKYVHLHPWVWASEREYMLYDEDEVVGQMLMTKQFFSATCECVLKTERQWQRENKV